MSKSLAPENNQDVLRSAKKEFIRVSCDKKLKWETELRFALQLLNKNKYLNDIAWNNKQSLQNAIVNVSAIGISLNPASKHAYLVPRDGGVCLDISYMGLIHLATSSGSLEWVQAKVVRKNDKYENKGVDSEPAHKYDAFNLEKRGGIVGAYCTAKTDKGDYLTEEMSIDDIWGIRNRSMAYRKKSGPWVTDVEQMIKKTVCKRASSYWPKVERFQNAVDILNNDSGEGIEFDAKPVDKRTTPGRNPRFLPGSLQAVYQNAREAFDNQDYETMKDIFYSFGDNDEMIAVTKCFNSKERAKLAGSGDFDATELERRNNTTKIYHLDDEELERLVDYNWGNAKTALPPAPSN